MAQVYDPAGVDLPEKFQNLLMDFFWNGNHWLQRAVLHLHQCARSSLIDLEGRLAAFCLHTLRCLVFTWEQLPWQQLPFAFVYQMGDLNLFLLYLNQLGWDALPPFHHSLSGTDGPTSN